MDVNLYAILLKDTVWDWTKARVVKDVVKLAAFFGDESNRGLMYVPKPEDVQVDAESPMLLLIPRGTCGMGAGWSVYPMGSAQENNGDNNPNGRKHHAHRNGNVT